MKQWIKHFITCLISCSVLHIGYHIFEQPQQPIHVHIDVVPQSYLDTLDLVKAHMFVESTLRTNVVVGDQVGCLQITKIMVDECNRLLKHNGIDLTYQYQDRLDCEKSQQIFWFIAKLSRYSSYEQIARCWNGGPKGMNKTATIKYWNKVRNQFNHYKQNRNAHANSNDRQRL